MSLDISLLTIATKNDLKAICNFKVIDRTTASIAIFSAIVYIKNVNPDCIFIQWGFHIGLLYTAGLLYFHFDQPLLSWHSAKYNIIFEQPVVNRYSSGVPNSKFVFFPLLFPSLSIAPYKANHESSIISSNKIFNNLISSKKDGCLTLSSLCRLEKLKDKDMQVALSKILSSCPKSKYIVFGNTIDEDILDPNLFHKDQLVFLDKFNPDDLDAIINLLDYYIDPFPFSGGHSLYRVIQAGLPFISQGASKCMYENSLSIKIYHFLKQSEIQFDNFNPLSCATSDSFSSKAIHSIKMLSSERSDSYKILFKEKCNKLVSFIEKQEQLGLSEWITNMMHREC